MPNLATWAYFHNYCFVNVDYIFVCLQSTRPSLPTADTGRSPQLGTVTTPTTTLDLTTGPPSTAATTTSATQRRLWEPELFRPPLDVRLALKLCSIYCATVLLANRFPFLQATCEVRTVDR